MLVAEEFARNELNSPIFFKLIQFPSIPLNFDQFPSISLNSIQFRRRKGTLVVLVDVDVGLDVLEEADRKTDLSMKRAMSTLL